MVWVTLTERIKIVALDCEKAFSLEMEKISNIVDRLDKILAEIANLKANFSVNKDNENSFDETNRLLKILCKNLVGVD